MLPSGSWEIEAITANCLSWDYSFSPSRPLSVILPGWILAHLRSFHSRDWNRFHSTTGQAILVASFPAKNGDKCWYLCGIGLYGARPWPLIGGIITQHAGWRSLFLIAVFFGIACIGVAHVFLKAKRKKRRLKAVPI